MWVLVLGQHASPEGHITKVPAGGEGVGVVCVSPNVAYPVARTPSQFAPSVSFPSYLSSGVAVQNNLTTISSVPDGSLSLAKSRIELPAVSNPIRKVGRSLPDYTRVGEIRMGESSL